MSEETKNFEGMIGGESGSPEPTSRKPNEFGRFQNNSREARRPALCGRKKGGVEWAGGRAPTSREMFPDVPKELMHDHDHGHGLHDHGHGPHKHTHTHQHDDDPHSHS